MLGGDLFAGIFFGLPPGDFLVGGDLFTGGSENCRSAGGGDRVSLWVGGRIKAGGGVALCCVEGLTPRPIGGLSIRAATKRESPSVNTESRSRAKS